MKVTFEYNLPDDELDYNLVHHARQMHDVLWGFKDVLRKYQKWGHEFKSADEAIEKISEDFYMFLNEYHVDLDVI